MTYRVQLTNRAHKAIEALGHGARERINQSLDRLLSYYEGRDVPQPDVKALRGKYRGLLRLRVGDWRIIFKIEAGSFIILLVDIVGRGGAYR